MMDIESQSKQNKMSLRKRKNPQSLPTANIIADDSSRNSTDQQKLRQHTKLMKEINSVVDEDEDDQARAMKEMMMKFQRKKNDEMTNAFLRIIIGIVFILILLYVIVLSHTPADEPSLMNSIVKVLRILLGMKTKQIYLASSKIVASTSIPKTSIDDFLIPGWPWQRGSFAAKKYLVPPGTKEPIKNILHEIMKLKHERGINIDIYDEDMMRDYLTSNIEECGNDTGTRSTNPTIVEKFDELRQQSIGKNNSNDHKRLWLWCMMYTGDTFGYLDVENHMIELSTSMLRKLSLGTRQYGIENLLINPSTVDGSNSETKAMMFISTDKSRVAKGMLQFMIKNSFSEETQIEELKRLIHFVSKEGENHENWVTLNAHCTDDRTDGIDQNAFAKVCTRHKVESGEAKRRCCQLVL